MKDLAAIVDVNFVRLDVVILALEGQPKFSTLTFPSIFLTSQFG